MTNLKGMSLILLAVICSIALAPFEEQAQGKEEVLEGAFFQGGYGLEWLFEVGRELEIVHPNVKAKVWGNPRLWDQVRTRFIAGNPPDVMRAIHNINYWDLLADGQVHKLDELMEMPAYGQEDVKFKDSFYPGVLEVGQYKGSQYFLPLTYVVYGLWYDLTMFEENRWTVPTTWEDFLKLCEKIKATGVAPLTHQGRYPSYFLIILRALWYKIGGNELLVDMDNMVPGAWKRPEVLRGAQMVKELIDRGYIQEGASALTHTEGQMEWLAGRAAMIPCGTWLENEMREVTPEGFRMRIFPIPGVEGRKGKASAVETLAGPAFLVPQNAKRPDLGMEFLRIALSKKTAQRFAQNIGDIIPIKGALEEVEISPSLKSAMDAAKAAEETFEMRFAQWYEMFNTDVENATSALFNGEIDPEKYVEKLEKMAEKLRKDKYVIKHTRKSPI